MSPHALFSVGELQCAQLWLAAAMHRSCGENCTAYIAELPGIPVRTVANAIDAFASIVAGDALARVGLHNQQVET